MFVKQMFCEVYRDQAQFISPRMHAATGGLSGEFFYTFIETGSWNCSCPVHNYIHQVPVDEKKKSDNSVLMSIIHI